MISRFPDFFIVGAQKAGTTWLHEALSTSPKVTLPKIKETHYFSHDNRFQLGVDWYFRQFPKEAQIVGEIDPEYMFYPSAAERIKQVVRSPKVVFLLRQPLERAYSHYLMSVSRGYETETFSEALLLETSRLRQETSGHSMSHHSYVSRGRYARQIAYFRKLFPNGEFLFVKFDDLFSEKSGEAAYREICDFLGIQPSISHRKVKANSASTPRSLILRNLLYRDSVLRAYLGRLVPSRDLKLRIGQWLDRLNQKPLRSSRLDVSIDPIHPRIVLELQEEIEALQRTTGLRCDDWIERLFVDHLPKLPDLLQPK